MAEEYEIDKLSLDIVVDTSKAGTSKIDKLSKSLDNLSDVVDQFPSLKVLSS